MGLATARLLASRGASLSLADVDEQGLNDVIKSLSQPEKHLSTVVDVRKREVRNSREVWQARCRGEHGRRNHPGETGRFSERPRLRFHVRCQCSGPYDLFEGTA